MKLDKDDRRLRQRLRDNDPTLERVEISSWMALVDPGHVDDFLQALGGNTFVGTFVIGPKAVEKLPFSTISRFLKTLPSLCSLRHVEISTPIINNARKRLDGEAVATFLQSCPGLETLVLWPFVCLDSNATIHKLALALSGHESLQTLCLHNIMLGDTLSNNDTSGSNSSHNDATQRSSCMTLDPILSALATVAHLQHVHLSPCFRVQDAACWIHNAGNLVALMNKCPLESLALRNMGLNDPMGVALAHAFCQSTTCRHVDLRFNPFSNVSGQAWLDTLEQHNYTLTSLSLPDIACDIDDKMDLLLRLNAAGRGALVHQGLPLEACWESFYAARNDIDVMFLLLRASPQLFSNSISAHDG